MNAVRVIKFRSVVIVLLEIWRVRPPETQLFLTPSIGKFAGCQLKRLRSVEGVDTPGRKGQAELNSRLQSDWRSPTGEVGKN